jgi:hypothetical protein
MSKYKFPDDLKFNNGLIQHPESYLNEVGCVSWLSLTGEEFALMECGMSFEQVQKATSHSLNVVSDPPRVLDLDLARKHISALDQLPRPTLVSCRVGPRSSAVAYMYSGLKQNADPEEIIQAAEQDKAPFIAFEEYKEWVRKSIETLLD